MKTVNLHFVVTEQCNLGCTYCFMNKLSDKVTLEVADKFIDSITDILKVYNKEEYQVQYFGGEPLLNWEVIKYTVLALKDDSRCKGQSITTNGLLLDKEKTEFLKSNRCKVCVSFDGIWSSERPLISGDSSLNASLSKLPLIKEYDLVTNTVLSPQGASTIYENFLYFIDELDIKHPCFTLVKENLWSDVDVENYKKSIKLVADEMISRFRAGESVSIGVLKLAIQDIIYAEIYGKRPYSCFVGKTGAAFMPDGVYYPCSRFGSNKKYPILDTINNIVYEENITRFKVQELTNPKTFKDCKGCEIRKWCNVACIYAMSEEQDHNFSVPITNVCELFKTNIKESLRIHAELKDNILYQNYIKDLCKFFKLRR